MVKLHRERGKKQEKSLKRHRMRMILKAKNKEKRQKASKKEKVAKQANLGKERKARRTHVFAKPWNERRRCSVLVRSVRRIRGAKKSAQRLRRRLRRDLLR